MTIINPSYNFKYLPYSTPILTLFPKLSSKYRHNKYVLLGMSLSQHLKTMTIKTIQIQFLTLFVSLYFHPTLMQPNCLDMGNSNAYMQRDASKRSLCPHKLAL